MMFYAKFPIDGVKKIYAHSLKNPVFTPTFSQLFEGQYRKDGKDVDVDGDGWPTHEEIDQSKLPAQVFCVKDDGAYLMAATEKTLPGDSRRNFVVYCAGCNPDVDDDFYETAREGFGGDDFSEALPLEWLKQGIENAKLLGLEHVVIKVSPESMELVTGKRI